MATTQAPAAKETRVPAPKLRDCCIACASSKVRCPRERPACSRCLKRKIKCEYLASKRAGRKHDATDTWAASANSMRNRDGDRGSSQDNASRLNAALLATTTALATTDPDAFNRLLPVLSTWLMPNGAAPGATATSTATTGASSTATSTFAMPAVAAPLSPLDANFLLQTPLELPIDPPLEMTTPPTSLLSPASHESNNSWASLIHLDGGSRGGGDPSDTFELGDGGADGIFSSFALSPGALLRDNFYPASNGIDVVPSPSPSVAREPINDVARNDATVPSGMHCSCLERALDLMRHLFPPPSTMCKSSNTGGTANELDLLPTISAVLERNSRTIDAVSSMLGCDCLQDANLLAIIAHIMFKVLGWYAVAARQAPMALLTRPSSSHDNGRTSTSGNSITNSRSIHSSSSSLSGLSVTRPSTLLQDQLSWQSNQFGHYCLDGDESSRMAAQLVLSELHRVQSLIRELMIKFQAVNRIDSSNEVSKSSLPDEQAGTPFSGEILDLLGMDLKRRLKELSAEIMTNLKNA